MGIHCQLFCEDNWDRYLDYLYELSTDTRLMFEYGDPKLIKEKLGKKHIITGLDPVTILKTHKKNNVWIKPRRCSIYWLRVENTTPAQIKTH